VQNPVLRLESLPRDLPQRLVSLNLPTDRFKVNTPDQKYEIVEAIIVQGDSLMVNPFGIALVQPCWGVNKQMRVAGGLAEETEVLERHG
jgi:hypothetical protein